MNAKELIQSLLPPIVLNALPPSVLASFRANPDDKELQHFLQNGKVPWSSGYQIYFKQFITKSVADENLLASFRVGGPLPAGYGHGLDERCVEFPWALSRLPANAERILDAGSALNDDLILSHSAFKDKKLHIVTLAPERTCLWHKAISYLYEDLRSIPIRDDFYDAVVCLSALEQVGSYNAMHTNEDPHRAQNPDDFQLVMRELRRVLKPGGNLFLSVPFGAHQQLGCFQVFDQALLTRAIEAFGETEEITETFYRYSSDGWQVATVEECGDCEFVGWLANAIISQHFPDPVPAESDLAAAARAVACLQLVKT